MWPFKKKLTALSAGNTGLLVALQAFFELEKKVAFLYSESGESPEDRSPYEITYFALVVVTFAIGAMGDSKKYPRLSDLADQFSMDQLKRLKQAGAAGNIVEKFRKRFAEYSSILHVDFQTKADPKNADAIAKIMNRYVGQQIPAPGILHKDLQSAYRNAAAVVSGAFR